MKNKNKNEMKEEANHSSNSWTKIDKGKEKHGTETQAEAGVTYVLFRSVRFNKRSSSEKRNRMHSSTSVSA